MPPSPRPIEDRFFDLVDVQLDLDACWEWRGAFNRPSEYFRQKHNGGVSNRPVFKVNNTVGVVYAHRFVLSLIDGVPLSERRGMEACHRPGCDNFRCVNPRHLYWGTPEENRKDRYRDRENGGPPALKMRLADVPVYDGVDH